MVTCLLRYMKQDVMANRGTQAPHLHHNLQHPTGSANTNQSVNELNELQANTAAHAILVRVPQATGLFLFLSGQNLADALILSQQLQAARTLQSRPINLDQDDPNPYQETPEQAMPSTGGSRETRMQKRLKQATIKAESEEAEDEVADDLSSEDDEDEEALDEEAEVSATPL